MHLLQDGTHCSTVAPDDPSPSPPPISCTTPCWYEHRIVCVLVLVCVYVLSARWQPQHNLRSLLSLLHTKAFLQHRRCVIIISYYSNRKDATVTHSAIRKDTDLISSL